jgi:hypothetical protein
MFSPARLTRAQSIGIRSRPAANHWERITTKKEWVGTNINDDSRLLYCECGGGGHCGFKSIEEAIFQSGTLKLPSILTINEIRARRDIPLRKMLIECIQDETSMNKFKTLYVRSGLEDSLGLIVEDNDGKECVTSSEISFSSMIGYLSNHFQLDAISLQILSSHPWFISHGIRFITVETVQNSKEPRLNSIVCYSIPPFSINELFESTQSSESSKDYCLVDKHKSINTINNFKKSSPFMNEVTDTEIQYIMLYLNRGHYQLLGSHNESYNNIQTLFHKSELPRFVYQSIFINSSNSLDMKISGDYSVPKPTIIPVTDQRKWTSIPIDLYYKHLSAYFSPELASILYKSFCVLHTNHSVMTKIDTLHHHHHHHHHKQTCDLFALPIYTLVHCESEHIPLTIFTPPLVSSSSSSSSSSLKIEHKEIPTKLANIRTSSMISGSEIIRKGCFSFMDLCKWSGYYDINGHPTIIGSFPLKQIENLRDSSTFRTLYIGFIVLLSFESQRYYSVPSHQRYCFEDTRYLIVLFSLSPTQWIIFGKIGTNGVRSVISVRDIPIPLLDCVDLSLVKRQKIS